VLLFLLLWFLLTVHLFLPKARGRIPRARMLSLGYGLLSLCLLFGVGSSFRWKVDDLLEPTNILTLSERYMFATNNGPALLEQGEASINIDTKLVVWYAKYIAG
jgi:hypothetical protein